MTKSRADNNHYSDEKGLSIRIKLHQKYSTNKMGFTNWLLGQYDFSGCVNILELGCGTGNQWENGLHKLPKDARLVLSDGSSGMVNYVKDNFSRYDNITIRQIDAQEIPFSDDSFDAVIANHLLFLIPDMTAAIAEIYRVLKPSGKFYATTMGNNGMTEYLHRSLKFFDPQIDVFNDKLSFTLQNGQEILHKRFERVEKMNYSDALSITSTQDLIDWIGTTQSLSSLSDDEGERLNDYFETIRREEGAINIPKEVGLFVAYKSSGNA